MALPPIERLPKEKAKYWLDDFQRDLIDGGPKRGYFELNLWDLVNRGENKEVSWGDVAWLEETNITPILEVALGPKDARIRAMPEIDQGIPARDMFLFSFEEYVFAALSFPPLEAQKVRDDETRWLVFFKDAYTPDYYLRNINNLREQSQDIWTWFVFCLQTQMGLDVMDSSVLSERQQALVLQDKMEQTLPTAHVQPSTPRL